MGYGMVELTADICRDAMRGATSDFEDNIAIESARRQSCDYIITYDKGFAKALASGGIQGMGAEEMAELMGWCEFRGRPGLFFVLDAGRQACAAQAAAAPPKQQAGWRRRP